jgi:hypothetical protein
MLGNYITGAQSRYGPFITGGGNAFNQAAGMQWNPLAPRFPALGTPASAMPPGTMPPGFGGGGAPPLGGNQLAGVPGSVALNALLRRG